MVGIQSSYGTSTAEVAGRLRNDARQFIKLDMAYLAAAGAIATVLKIDRYDLIDFVAAMRGSAYLYIGLLAYDVVASSLLSREWAAAKREAGKRMPRILVLGLHTVQPFRHFLFFAALTTYWVAYSSNY